MLGYLSVLGGALHSLGLAQEAQHRHAEAERAYRQAIERQRIAFEKAPKVTVFRLYLSRHYSALGALAPNARAGR